MLPYIVVVITNSAVVPGVKPLTAHREVLRPTKRIALIPALSNLSTASAAVDENDAVPAPFVQARTAIPAVVTRVQIRRVSTPSSGGIKVKSAPTAVLRTTVPPVGTVASVEEAFVTVYDALDAPWRGALYCRPILVFLLEKGTVVF
jgi:hypothetical protein